MIIAAALLLFTIVCLLLSGTLSWSNVTLDARNDLVFTDRHQTYGAYQLRHDHGRYMLMAFGSTIGLMAAIVGIAMIDRSTTSMAVVAPPLIVLDVDLQTIKPPVRSTSDEVKSPKPLDPIKHASSFVEATSDSMPKQEKLSQDSLALFAPEGVGPGSGASAATGLKGITSGGSSLLGQDTLNVYQVSVIPAFPGGDEAMRQWLRHNINFPDAVGKSQVFIQFVVDTDGMVRQVRAIKGGQAEFNREAERAVAGMPRWSPARMGDHPVACRLTLPIRFETR